MTASRDRSTRVRRTSSRGLACALVLALLPLATPAPAQIQVQAVVERDLLAYTHRVVAGTVVAPGGRMGGGWTCQFGPGGTFESISYDLRQPAPDTFDAEFRIGAQSTFGSFCPGLSARALGALRLEITSPTRIAGTLVFEVGQASDEAELDLDVGADGIRELDAGGTAGNPGTHFYSAPVVLGPTPTLVVVGGECRARLSASSVAHRVRFMPGVAVGRNGTTCGARLGLFAGPAATDGTRAVEIRYETDRTWDAAFLVVGTQPRLLPIPPSMCPLRTDILVPLQVARPFRFIPRRENLRLPMPAGLDVRLQLLAGSAVGGEEVWSTSPALRVRVR